MGVEIADVVDTSLCQLARKLLVMPSSLAASDHIFSSYDLFFVNKHQIKELAE